MSFEVSSDDILEVLKIVDEIFPIPLCNWDDGTPFDGKHGFVLDDGKLNLAIWVEVGGKITSVPFIFAEPETLTFETLQGMALMLQEELALAKAKELADELTGKTV